MGTLWSELGPVADAVADRPRVYADANVPAGLISFMRERLKWDVLSVMDHPDLRRARDTEHFRLARQLRRTLITLDRDYLDDRRFPLAECGGVLVVSGPDEASLARLLVRFDRAFFPRKADSRQPTADSGRGAGEHGTEGPPPTAHSDQAREQNGLPLEGRKLHVHPDW